MIYKNIKTWNWMIYLLNFSLLITHEIDSAYWKEWELFGMKSDIQEFLIINFILILIGLIGFRYLISGNKNAYYIALFFSAGGIFAFCIHMYFIVNGHQEFSLPVSIILLFGTLIVSLLQGILAIQSLRNNILDNP
jgi:hypothetical protein